MRAASPKVVSPLVRRSLTALGVRQKKLAEMLSTSLRTVSRWAGGSTSPSAAQMTKLAALVLPRDRALAAQIAAASGATLESLGLVPPAPPPPPPRPPVPQMIEGVVFAAAEAADLSPRAVGPALLAAFARASAVGLTLEEAVGGLKGEG